MNIRAKVQCSSVYPNSEGSTTETANFHGVYGGDTNAEDNTFSAATPYLALTMGISNQAAVGTFKVGQKYFIDFTPAE